MSAFICSPEHFATIAEYATKGNIYSPAPVSMPWLQSRCAEHGIKMDDPAQTIAGILYVQNLRSFNHRYSETDAPDAGFLQGQHIVGPQDPVSILKMLACLEYQSCETTDYAETLAYDLLRAIRAGAIRQLPGYDDAPWAYDAGYTHTVETIHA